MELLQAVLDKYERSDASIIGEMEGNSSYRVQDTLYRKVPRKQIAEEAKQLEAAGLCKIKWLNGYHGVDVELIQYPKVNLIEFYRMAGRVPRYERIRMCRQEIEDSLATIKMAWIRRYLEDMREKADKGKIEEDLAFRQGILACLMELDTLTEPVFHRVFSRKVFQDSKKFELVYQKEIMKIARTFYEEAVTAEMSEKEVLEQIYIDDYSQELMLKGRLQLCIRGKWVNLSDFPYGVTLNAQTIKEICDVRAMEIKKVLTIENKANYLSESVDAEKLVIFSHGYFSPLERDFMRLLRKRLPKETAYYHSGDLDYGGICIFRYIRERIFPEVQPWNMSPEILEQYHMVGRTESLEESKWDKLRDMEEPQLQPLIQFMIEHRVQMEQEEFLVGGN